MNKDLGRYDTSDYPEDNVFELPRVNKKVPGHFKDELNSQIIIHFVGLRSKMYCIKAGKITKTTFHNGKSFLNKVRGYEQMKKAKGIKKYVLKNQITFKDYHNCILNHSILTLNQNSIRSKMHRVYSITQKKVALSASDNKLIIMENNIDTLPRGHYKAL